MGNGRVVSVGGLRLLVGGMWGQWKSVWVDGRGREQFRVGYTEGFLLGCRVVDGRHY